MAEAIGLVSGALTLAHTLGELGSVVIRLKALWGEIERAPQRVRSLVEEMQILSHLLSDIDSQLNNTVSPDDVWDSGYTAYATRYCRQVFDTLSSLGADLHHEIDSLSRLTRKLGAVRVVLKEGIIRSLERQLRSACGLLQICLQCYSIALGRVSHDKIDGIFTLLQEDRTIRLAKPTQNEPPDAPQKSLHYTRSPRAKKRLYKSALIGTISISTTLDSSLFVATAIPPPWLRSLAWSLTVSRHLQQFNMRYYNNRPNNSDIFMRVKSKDLAGMLHHFQNRSASPFDRDERGLTLLHYAASTGDLAICQKLLELGLDSCIDEDLQDSFSPREIAVLAALWDEGEVSENSIANTQLLRLFGHSPYPEDDYCFFLLGCSSGRYDLTVISALQRLVAPSLHSLPARDRLELARAYCCISLPGDHPDPGIVKYLLRGGESLLPTDVLQSVWEGFSIIHTTAISFGRACRTVTGPTKGLGGKQLVRWRRFAADIITLSKPFMLGYVEKVHHKYAVEICPQVSKADWVGTSLLSLLKGCSLDCFDGSGADLARAKDAWQQVTSFTLAGWLERLTSCGIDLGEYGKKEKEIFDQRPQGMEESYSFALSFNQWVASEQKHTSLMLVARLQSFGYGFDLADWCLVWEMDDQRTAACSRQEEKPQDLPDSALLVPGAWVE
ncbi:hypothetical protein B0T25DRAFT_552263 [Lasiosphaeria hispida]|uniref:Fungal N-terminal domain-containing protein n=1 Tax=Lasiosphaeria hispida TaxID=260671 RepID=A0AAJ0MB68_9PEZI|nr:hypothetical protein B0T25DRAFT_552263 [Lasiosphaeria hispida]